MPANKIVNIPWQETNNHRNYPFHDRSSRKDINGSKLPTDVITDVHIWFPDSLGSKCVVSSIGISSGIASITFGAIDGSNNVTPLGAVSVVKPVIEDRQYPINSFVDGVMGWVSFGAGANNYTNQFNTFSVTGSGIEATELLATSAKAYTVSGVTKIKQQGRDATLQGLVNLVSTEPNRFKVSVEQRTIETVGTVDCLVFGLNEEVAGPDIYQEFLYKCDVSPDSGTCLRDPITSINSAVPDCNGQITVIFDEVEDTGLGRLTTINIVEGDRMVLDFDLGMSDVCQGVFPTFANDQVTKCDDPCDDFDDNGPFDGYVPQYGP